jgi:hypothetical protein
MANRADSDGSIGLNLELGITFLDVYIFFRELSNLLIRVLPLIYETVQISDKFCRFFFCFMHDNPH